MKVPFEMEEIYITLDIFSIINSEFVNTVSRDTANQIYRKLSKNNFLTI
jgi:hypothetical protein